MLTARLKTGTGLASLLCTCIVSLVQPKIWRIAAEQLLFCAGAWSRFPTAVGRLQAARPGSKQTAAHLRRQPAAACCHRCLPWTSVEIWEVSTAVIEQQPEHRHVCCTTQRFDETLQTHVHPLNAGCALFPSSLVQLYRAVAGMPGAEPLSPATLAYFTNAAALHRSQSPGTTAAPGQSGSHTSIGGPQRDGEELGTPAGELGTLAGDLLSPFQSGAPSPLAVLHALQGDAGASDGSAGADVLDQPQKIFVSMANGVSISPHLSECNTAVLQL